MDRWCARFLRYTEFHTRTMHALRASPMHGPNARVFCASFLKGGLEQLCYVIYVGGHTVVTLRYLGGGQKW